MDMNSANNQSYWFVIREDQSNVIFNSNNFTIQNPHIAGTETRYIVDTSSSENQQFIQINETPILPQEISVESKVPKPTEQEQSWDRNKVLRFLTLCRDKYKDIAICPSLWNEISLSIEMTSEECSKKYSNLKRTYLRLLRKKQLGKNIKWVYYNLCEEVFKYCSELSPANLEPWEDSKVKMLLTLYIENLHRLRNKECIQKDIWMDIASQLGTTRYNCYHKFKNLKRTYLNWLSRSKETGRITRWPYCMYFDRIFYNNDPSVGIWSKAKIKQLIAAYSTKANKFRSGKYQKKELWKEIAAEVGVNAHHCDRKFRNLKQTYLRLKRKADFEGSNTVWDHYKEFEEIFGDKIKYTTVMNDGNQIIQRCSEEDYIKELLTFCIENKDKFKDPLQKKKNLWRIVASKVGMTAAECDKKYRNLKQTYVRLLEKKRQTGKLNSWPYYYYFEQIYGDAATSTYNYTSGVNIDDATFSEIKRVVHNAQCTSDKDKFEKLVRLSEESNVIQRERNKILQALLARK